MRLGRVKLSVAGLFLATLPFYSHNIQSGNIILYPPEVVIYAVLVASLLFAWSRQRLLATVSAYPIWKIIGLTMIIVGGVIGTYYSPLFPETLGALKTWIISPVIAYVLATALLDAVDWRSIRVLAVLLGCVVSVYGIYLVLGHDSTRLSSIFDSPNFFGAFIAPLLVLDLYLVRENVGSKRGLYAILFIVLFVGLLLSRSLGAWIGFGIASFVFVTQLRNSALRWTLIALIVIISLTGLLVARTRLTQKDNSLTSRLEIWRTGTYIVDQHPLVGSGLRGFPTAYNTVVTDVLGHVPQEWGVPQPHNFLLSLWVNIGVIGLVGFLLILGGSLSSGLTASNGWSLALLTVLIHGLVDTPYWQTALVMMLWLYLAAISPQR